MDKKRKMFYIGCHWGTEDDGYICSSNWMLKTYKRRPETFKRRVVIRGLADKPTMFAEELRLLSKIKPHEVKTRYYNFHIRERLHWSAGPNAKTIAQKSGEARRGRKLKVEPDRGAKISAAKKGKPLTEAHKAALSVAKKGSTLSAEHRQKISTSLKANANKKPGGSKPKLPRPICPTCGIETHSLRATYCKEHRYDAMNASRSKVGKWSKPLTE